MSALAFPHTHRRTSAHTAVRPSVAMRAARRGHLSAVPGGRTRGSRSVDTGVSVPTTDGSSAVAFVASPQALSRPAAPLPTRQLVPVLPEVVAAPRPAPVTEPLSVPERHRPARRPVRRDAVRPEAVRPVEQVAPAHTVDDAPMRLTVRGMWVLVVLGLVAAAVLGTVLGLAFSSGPAVPTEVATVVVAPGESLWAIASEHAEPGADIRDVIEQIIDLNSLASSTVVAGQELTVPVG